jgi:MobA/MobL family
VPVLPSNPEDGMAIYHLHVKNISRAFGRSAVACAAYRAGQVLPNDAEERLTNFGGRRNVLLAEIHLPEDAPEWMADRARLWNTAEAQERRKDARLAKEVEFSLPRELSPAQRIAAAREMAVYFTAKGHVVDLAIHDDGNNHNPHCHLMLATRAVSDAGFGMKIRTSDSLAFVTDARTTWALIANTALKKAGAAVIIDPRSYKAQRLEKTPGKHDGVDRPEKIQDTKRKRKAMASDKKRNVEDSSLPVPDPDGRPISQEELDEAQRRMLDEMERPAGGTPDTLQTGRGDNNQLRQSAQAIERENHAQEPLGWLDATPQQRQQAAVGTDNPLEWLREESSAHPDTEKIEWDRSR